MLRPRLCLSLVPSAAQQGDPYLCIHALNLHKPWESELDGRTLGGRESHPSAEVPVIGIHALGGSVFILLLLTCQAHAHGFDQHCSPPLLSRDIGELSSRLHVCVLPLELLCVDATEEVTVGVFWTRNVPTENQHRSHTGAVLVSKNFMFHRSIHRVPNNQNHGNGTHKHSCPWHFQAASGDSG